MTKMKLMRMKQTKPSEVDTKEQSGFTVNSCLQTSKCTLKVNIDDFQLEDYSTCLFFSNTAISHDLRI